MTVQELIEMLQEQDPEAQVQVNLQPSYPLAANITSVIAEEDPEGPADEHLLVWIVTAEPHGYAPRF